jgi:hypothetical protein
MNTNLIKGGIVVLLVITAALFFVFTRNFLIIVTGLLFVVGTGITWNSDDRCLYSFIAGIPLVVTAGESEIMVGIALLIILVILLVAEILQKSDMTECLSFIIIPVILVTLGLLFPAANQAHYVLLFFLLIALGSTLFFTVRNRLLKERYMREIL